MPLAQNPRFVQEENDVLTTYKQQAEFLLKEISLRALPSSKMTILVDHHCFNYIVENGICFLTLCESSYPRKLAFHYLEDLHQEFERLDKSLTDRITKPYTFIKLGNLQNVHYSLIYCCISYFRYREILCFKTEVQAIRCTSVPFCMVGCDSQILSLPTLGSNMWIQEHRQIYLN